MTFECAAVLVGARCQSQAPGDHAYLGVLTFCASHQEAFEEIAGSNALQLEVAGAKMTRSPVGQIFANWNPPPIPPPKTLRERREESSAYFMRCAGFVKIGYSSQPLHRLSQVQNGSALYPEGMPVQETLLIATEPGGWPREQELHAKFAHLRHTGEWFTEAPELTEYINQKESIPA